MVVQEDVDMYLDNIDEYLNDENKLVTYKWLSYSLGIHVNKSKSLLEEYLSTHNEEVDVVYMVGGRTGSLESLKYGFKLCRKDELEQTKHSYDTVTCCHVYALQKVPIKDSSMLYSADVDIIRNSAADVNKWSAIQCKAANERRIIPTNQSVTNLQDITKAKKAETNLPDEKKATPGLAVATQKQPAATTKTKENLPTSFFSKKASVNADKKKSESTSTTKSSDTKSTTTKTSAASPGSSALSKAFARAPQKAELKSDANATSTKKTAAIAEQKSESLSKNESEPIMVGKSKPKSVDESDFVSKTKKDIVLDKSTGADYQKRNSKKDEEIKQVNENTKAVSQKRKAESDSEDEEGFENFVSKSKEPVMEENLKKPSDKQLAKSKDADDDVDTDVVAATPEPTKKSKMKTKRRKKAEEEKTESQNEESTLSETAPKEVTDPSPLCVDSSGSGKRKKRGRKKVLKSKQFMNDEGFMVTEKVYESESYSEESETETVKPKLASIKSLPKTVDVANKKTKQASLSSFFKKK